MKSLATEQVNPYHAGEEVLGAMYPQAPRLASDPPRERTTDSPSEPKLRRLGSIQLVGLIEWLNKVIPLPNSRRSFGLYMVAFLIVIAGMMTHVLLSAQILQLQVELSVLEGRHSIIERETGEVLWEIGRVTNLRHVEERAKAAGYAPITEREYVGVKVAKAPLPDASAQHTPHQREMEAVAADASVMGVNVARLANAMLIKQSQTAEGFPALAACVRIFHLQVASFFFYKLCYPVFIPDSQ